MNPIDPHPGGHTGQHSAPASRPGPGVGPAVGCGFGVGLKSQHLPDILGGAPVPLELFEIHAENYMGAGGPLLNRLARVRERHDLSVHGVGLSLGGMARPSVQHLRQLRALLQRVEPLLFSEHLAWSSHGDNAFNDLLPLPYNAATLQRVCEHIDAVQNALRRPMLLENPSTYVEFAASEMSEPQFLAEVVRLTGCGLLLDVNNLFVSATNHGWDAQTYLDALPLQQVGEIHLAGHADDRQASSHGHEGLLIDTHGSPVAHEVWTLFSRAAAACPPVPVIIERDQNIPALEILLQEVSHARKLAAA